MVLSRQSSWEELLENVFEKREGQQLSAESSTNIKSCLENGDSNVVVVRNNWDTIKGKMEQDKKRLENEWEEMKQQQQQQSMSSSRSLSHNNIENDEEERNETNCVSRFDDKVDHLEYHERSKPFPADPFDMNLVPGRSQRLADNLTELQILAAQSAQLKREYQSMKAEMKVTTNTTTNESPNKYKAMLQLAARSSSTRESNNTILNGVKKEDDDETSSQDSYSSERPLLSTISEVSEDEEDQSIISESDITIIEPSLSSSSLSTYHSSSSSSSSSQSSTSTSTTSSIPSTCGKSTTSHRNMRCSTLQHQSLHNSTCLRSEKLRIYEDSVEVIFTKNEIIIPDHKCDEDDKQLEQYRSQQLNLLDQSGKSHAQQRRAGTPVTPVTTLDEKKECENITRQSPEPQQREKELETVRERIQSMKTRLIELQELNQLQTKEIQDQQEKYDASTSTLNEQLECSWMRERQIAKDLANSILEVKYTKEKIQQQAVQQIQLERAMKDKQKLTTMEIDQYREMQHQLQKTNRWLCRELDDTKSQIATQIQPAVTDLGKYLGVVPMQQPGEDSSSSSITRMVVVLEKASERLSTITEKNKLLQEMNDYLETTKKQETLSKMRSESIQTNELLQQEIEYCNFLEKQLKDTQSQVLLVSILLVMLLPPILLSG